MSFLRNLCTCFYDFEIFSLIYDLLQGINIDYDIIDLSSSSERSNSLQNFTNQLEPLPNTQKTSSTRSSVESLALSEIFQDVALYQSESVNTGFIAGSGDFYKTFLVKQETYISLSNLNVEAGGETKDESEYHQHAITFITTAPSAPRHSSTMSAIDLYYEQRLHKAEINNQELRQRKINRQRNPNPNANLE